MLESFEREKIIIKHLEAHGSGSVESLSKICNVTTMTIRRDLDKLKNNGLIEKRYGGAILKDFLHKEIPYVKRENLYSEIKSLIAHEAFKLINDEDTILLDAGTTTLAIAHLLSTKKNITVITNDIHIAVFLASIEIKTYIAGGLIESATGCTFSSTTVDFLNTLQIDIAFVGVSAINTDFMCLAHSIEKSDVKKAMMNVSRKKVLVIDSSKFAITAFCNIALVSDFSSIITNYIFEKKDEDYIKSKGCEIINVG